MSSQVCLVCGETHSAPNACPVCKFPIVHMPKYDDAAKENLRPTILSYRKQLLSNIDIAIVAYSWKDDNGYIALDKKTVVPIGKASEIAGESSKWVNQKFARIADEEKLDVTVQVSIYGNRREKQYSLPNLTEAQLQEVGASIDSELNLRMLLKNDTKQVSSKKEPLFPDI